MVLKMLDGIYIKRLRRETHNPKSLFLLFLSKVVFCPDKIWVFYRYFMAWQAIPFGIKLFGLNTRWHGVPLKDVMILLFCQSAFNRKKITKTIIAKATCIHICIIGFCTAWATEQEGTRNIN